MDVLQKKQYLKIQKIHHKALKVVYNSNKNYDELLRNDNKVLTHQSHLRALICEGPLLRLPAAKSTCLLWNSLPQSIKYSESIVELKTKMKDLGNIDCSCILCR